MASKTSKKASKTNAETSKKEKCPNANTQKIGCFLNVNAAKLYLRDYISNTLQYELGTINSQCSYAALTELLFKEILRSASFYTKSNSDKADLYEITETDIITAINNDQMGFPIIMKQYIVLYKIGPKTNYTMMIYDNKRLRDFIVSQIFTNKTNITISEDGLNCVCYLISTIVNNIVNLACHFANYGNQKNVTIKSFNHAAKYFIGCNELSSLINKRLEEIANQFYKSKENNSDAASAASSSTESTSKEAEAPKKKEAVKGKKKKEEEVQEEEEEEDEEDEEEDDDEDEEEEEEEDDDDDEEDEEEEED